MYHLEPLIMFDQFLLVINVWLTIKEKWKPCLSATGSKSPPGIFFHEIYEILVFEFYYLFLCMPQMPLSLNKS